MSTTITALSPADTTFWPGVGWTLLLIGAILAAANAVLFVTVPGYDDGVQKDRMFAIAAIGYAHTLGGAIASLIGPFQFLGSLRKRHRQWHIWLGRFYLTCVGVGVGGLAGLYLSPNSYARNTLGIAFVALALRVQMPLLIVFGGLSPILALNIVGWTCWVPNLLIVEMWMRRRQARPVPLGGT